MKFSRRLSLLLCLIALTVVGCRYNLVDEPTFNLGEKKNAADYKDYILPPMSVSASHGKSKSVYLKWSVVENAVRYQIYSAETPYSLFSKVMETKGPETEITIDEESGVTKYYCITAVNYYGTISQKSVLAKGSSLAIPVITSIEPSEEGNAVKLNWWMDNCTSETYAKSVYYNISVYSSNLKIKTIEKIDGQLNHINIAGLNSNTEYDFEIEVVEQNSGAKESSGKTNAQTAKRVVPDAPLGVVASQGSSKDEIKLTWKLPQACWYRENSGVSGFVLHPLYFNIYRKNSYQSDDQFKLISSLYIEANSNWKYRTNNDNKELITVNDSDKCLEAPYQKYNPDQEVSWIDTEAERGKKYVYYIQAVTDDTPEGKIITSESSKSEFVEGWKLGTPLFSIISDYEVSEDQTEFTKISFAYNVAFESFEKTYTYFIEREKFDLQKNNISNSKQILKYNNLSSLNNSKDVFQELFAEEGYYSYTLYICSDGSEDNSSPLETIRASGKYLVTKDAASVPVVKDFTLQDGYSNYFNLSWKFNPEYKYIIHWKNPDNGDEDSLEIPSEYFAGRKLDDEVVYKHEAVSGDRRIYTLEASTGLSEFFRPNNDATEIVYETLGTAMPEIASYDYDKICVKWLAVQKSSGVYKVSAKYENENKELVTSENISITENSSSDGEKQYLCIIEKPEGFDNAKKSGKTIKLQVTTSNETLTDETTSKALAVRTIGPASMDVTTTISKYSDRIIVNWKPIEGADGYLIRRIAYKVATNNPETITDDSFYKTDIYYYNGGELSANQAPVTEARATVSLSNDSYKLTDYYKEASDEQNAYESNQSSISWGSAFGYVVIPVKKGGNADDIIFNGKTVQIKDSCVYNNLQEIIGSTTGYGLNVHAEKSESADKQTIEWNLPYKSSDFNKNPSIYYRDADNNENKWEKAQSVTFSEILNGKQRATFKPTKATAAYEYLVAYEKSTSTLVNIIPASFIKDSVLGLSSKDSVYTYQNQDEKEFSNKGYLLAVNYSARTGFETSEEAEWEEWDYTQRAIGPTKAIVRIRNYNISSNWIDIAELDKDLHFEGSLNPENTLVEEGNDAVAIRVSPKTLMDGTTNNPITKGPLMVLRDAKHYYSLELIRGDKSVELGIDDSVYAYRNITQKELVKCALLNMAYGFYINASGKDDLSNVDSKLGYDDGNKSPSINGSGTAQFGKRSLLGISEAGKYSASVSMSDFAPLQLTPGGNKSCVVAITMSDVSTRTKSLTDTCLDKFRTENFELKVTKAYSELPDSYSGTFIMKCTGSDNLVIQSGSTVIINAANSDARRCYFPIRMNDDHYWLKTQKYGWWTE